MNDESAYFRAALPELLKKRGYSQRDLMKKCGVPQQTISRMKNGVRNIPEETMKQIATGFDLPLGEILAMGRRLLENRIDIGVNNGQVANTMMMTSHVGDLVADVCEAVRKAMAGLNIDEQIELRAKLKAVLDTARKTE